VLLRVSAASASVCIRGQVDRLLPHLVTRSPLEIQKTLAIYLAVKNWGLILLTCGTMIFGGCANDEEFHAAETGKTQEKVPGETNPDAPDASQQQQAKPGFRF
jgi:hypothetical protein